MARNRIVTRGGRRSDRQSVWFAAAAAPAAIAASSKVLVLSLNAAGLAARPFTVVRTQVLINYESDQLAASERVHGAMGWVVVSDQAIGAGVASIPGPVTNPDAPFFVYQGLIDSFLFGSGVGFESTAGQSTQVDSKAMRKVGANEDIAIVVENAAALGATFTMEGRMLVKFH